MRILTAVMSGAWHAAWRLMLVVTVLVGGASTCIAWVLLAAGLRLADVSPLITVGPALALSIFTHEAGHAIAYYVLCCNRDENAEVVGIGTFHGGEIVRWSLGSEADAVIALVGPIGGLLPMIAVLSWPGPHLVGYPLVILFFVHLMSLTPGAADGAQVIAHWSELHEREGSLP